MDAGSSIQLGDSLPQIILFIVLLMGAAYCASAESAFSAMNKIRIKNYADDGNKRAKNAIYVSNNFDRALTTLLIGNNITHIACASIATLVATNLWGDGALTVSTLVTTVIVFLFSEMLPKAFANTHSDAVAMAYSGSLRFLMKILRPVAFFFTSITSVFKRFFKTKEEPSVTEEELFDIIDTIEAEGVIDEDQSELLQSALEFDDTTVADVMTMRDDIYFIDINSPIEEILSKIRETRFSRLPVCDKSVDKVLGIMQVRVFLKNYIKSPNVNIRELLLPPFFVEKSRKIDDLLTEMSRRKAYIALVKDENETVGLVTIEDFLEELVGEIWDEDDVVDDNFIKLGGNRFMIDGRLPIGEALSRIGYTPEAKLHLNLSVQAWTVEMLGRIPEDDEEFTFEDLEITVDEVEEGSVSKFIFKLNEEE